MKKNKKGLYFISFSQRPEHSPALRKEVVVLLILVELLTITD